MRTIITKENNLGAKLLDYKTIARVKFCITAANRLRVELLVLSDYR